MVRFYSLISLITISIYIWLFLNIRGSHFHACHFKNVFNIPCPSCGTTRGVIELLNGNIIASVLINPLSLIYLSAAIIIPLWLLYDLFFKKSTLYKTSLKLNRIIKKKRVLIPLFIIIAINWMWNIYKNL
jgi:hypothetical protein